MLRRGLELASLLQELLALGVVSVLAVGSCDLFVFAVAQVPDEPHVVVASHYDLCLGLNLNARRTRKGTLIRAWVPTIVQSGFGVLFRGLAIHGRLQTLMT